MNTFDNIGGVISVDYIQPVLLNYFTSYFGSVHLELKSGYSWSNIPMSYMGCDSQEEIELTDSGSLVTSDIAVLIPFNKITVESVSNLRNILSCSGIIFRLRTTDGKYFIIGSPDYPLFGTIKNTSPKNPVDFRGYQIIISSKSEYQMLSLI